MQWETGDCAVYVIHDDMHWCLNFFSLKFLKYICCRAGGLQLAARGPHVARHIIFYGPQWWLENSLRYSKVIIWYTGNNIIIDCDIIFIIVIKCILVDLFPLKSLQQIMTYSKHSKHLVKLICHLVNLYLWQWCTSIVLQRQWCGWILHTFKVKLIC